MLIYIVSSNKQEGRKNMTKMYVDAYEVKPKAYKMIKELKEKMLKDNPNLIVIAVRSIENFMKKTVMDKRNKYKR